jgi:phosphoribosylformylglycinamidine cyclo-ligase
VPAGGLDYASSGVDIDLEGTAIASLVSALGRSVRGAGSRGAPVDLPGGFGGLIEFGDSLLAMAADGVGSKLQIANALGRLEGVGHDCVAMNVNDLLCVGAEPIAFVDYIATPKPDEAAHAALGASLAEACALARVTLAGGETATLPGIVKELDLSGTALGWLPRDAAITGTSLVAGDVIIGLPSSGIHSNGYSLVRSLVELSGASLNAAAPFDTTHPNREIRRFPNNDGGKITLGEVLLNPTRIYCDPVADLVMSARRTESGRGWGRDLSERDGLGEPVGPCEFDDIHGIAHITGGGLSNLLRLHPAVGWDILEPLPVPPEFGWIAAAGNVNNREMHRTFNMGMGMVIAVSAGVGDAVSAWLSNRLAGSRIVGVVSDSGHRVVHTDSTVFFDRY